MAREGSQRRRDSVSLRKCYPVAEATDELACGPPQANFHLPPTRERTLSGHHPWPVFGWRLSTNGHGCSAVFQACFLAISTLSSQGFILKCPRWKCSGAPRHYKTLLSLEPCRKRQVWKLLKLLPSRLARQPESFGADAPWCCRWPTDFT